MSTHLGNEGFIKAGMKAVVEVKIKYNWVIILHCRAILTPLLNDKGKQTDKLSRRV